MAVGPWQIVLIALVILLLFGAGRLGDIGKGLGEGIRNFKKGITEDPDESDDDADEEDEEPKQLAGKSLSDKQAVRKKQNKA
jgi:sec-independent protein translocase protein TatA